MEKAPSLFLSERWTKLEENILGLRTEIFKGHGCVAKITFTKSKLPMVPKAWMGGYWVSGTGIGLYCKDPSQSSSFYNKIKPRFGVIQGISNCEIPGISGKVFTKIIDISQSRTNLMASFTKKRRNGIRQGLKRGIKIKEIEDSREAVEIIFEIKSKYAYWNRSREETEAVLDYCFRNDLMKLLVAYLDNEPVAEALFTLWNKRMTYSISGHKREYNWYKPMDALMWQSMMWGKRKGFKELDIMGGYFEGQAKSGINKFKSEFGGSLETRYFFREIRFGPLSF